ncbi:hypothetical protein BU24DRAFT_350800 [Aaosphaeria arxii CBS 175.79]|uniref:Tcp11-domain-containing protein n=1 Tax=Aaosphaeria arxii CBS 175.79 TaxID=1450172 RepID=A0A6A5XKD0_9PLEO|nr:uncharacterized protein BU24DRAFT_350800 [Aaosphaeria arxii CBS 175.79]KAF2013738.1 hypothetical protein BU24DRAFT_350800 [Aaosphaeria arxii CBS 175.79]
MPPEVGQFGQLLIRASPRSDAQILADAFQNAAECPPITKQSLCELNIESIITNPKLRHDVNHDRDLSFRPNTDGTKGQQKRKEGEKYWCALEAELELYTLIHVNGALFCNSRDADMICIMKTAQRRIPIIFDTIKDILKGLVPERDHERVNEHLDVPKLMREIERGVCDLVRLAEWVAVLLKEHCAPMRDISVDKMVQSIASGAQTNNSRLIVEGLRQLLSILEAMKLDVANHQIRSLKTLLIEETVHFEKQYHLERIVSHRARINIDDACDWYNRAVNLYEKQCRPSRDQNSFHMDIFVRAVISNLLRNRSAQFPDTFYLDQDRLRVLRNEIDDLICIDICMDWFELILKGFGHTGEVPTSTKQNMRASLVALLGEGLGHGSLHMWLNSSEHIVVELLRQASKFIGYEPAIALDNLQKLDQNLQCSFRQRTSRQTERMEERLLTRVLSESTRHMQSSPLDLFNALVANSTPPTTSSAIPGLPLLFNKQNDSDPSSDQLTDISARITHVILLHWRTWADIAYVCTGDSTSHPQDDLEGGQVTTATAQTKPTASTASVNSTDHRTGIGPPNISDKHETLESPARPFP